MPSFTFLISISGIVYSVTVAIYSISDTQIKSIDAVYQHAFDDFFVILNAWISIIAWLLFLSSAGTTTPLVAVLFILAEAVFVLKEGINLALFCCYEARSINRDASADIQRHQARLAIEVEAQEKKAWVNLVSALWLTVIVAGWCMVPESLVVGALSLIAMGLVYWERHDAIERIETEKATILQPIVDELTSWWMDGNELSMKSRVCIGLVASNDGSRDRDRWADWHHRDAPVTGCSSQAGLFSRKSDYNRTGNDVCVSDNQRNHQSVMVGLRDKTWHTPADKKRRCFGD